MKRTERSEDVGEAGEITRVKKESIKGKEKTVKGSQDYAWRCHTTPGIVRLTMEAKMTY